MILSNTELQAALDHGWIRITPPPEPRQPSVERECPYQTTAVDLRLSTEISCPKNKAPITVDLREGGFKELSDAYYQPFVLTESQPWALKPGTFVLGRTLERITLPIPTSPDQPCYAARIEGRSSYARCGLTVHLTAPTIHANYDGVVTLEICNFGNFTISLFPEMYICQMIFEKVMGIPFRNDSQFQGQTSATGAR